MFLYLHFICFELLSRQQTYSKSQQTQLHLDNHNRLWEADLFIISLHCSECYTFLPTVMLCRTLCAPHEDTMVVHWLLVRYEDLYGALGGFTADGALVNLLGTLLTHTHVATGNEYHL